MDLEKLQKNGAIHIGLKSAKVVLYAYTTPEFPKLVAVGWTSSGVAMTEAGPVIDEVMERTKGCARFLMVCHHSSAKELLSKIRDGLAVKHKAAVAPKDLEVDDREHWFRTDLNDVVFAYPPFAKIFLSEVPTFSDEIGAAGAATEVGTAGAAGKVVGGYGRSRHGDDEDEDERVNPARLLLRSRGVQSLFGGALVLGVFLVGAIVGLEQMKRSSEGREWLLGVESDLGFSFGTLAERGIGFLTDAERDARMPKVVVEGEFSSWYDPTRGEDAGNTFGMPRETEGFFIKTWVDGTMTDQNLYAAYRFNPSVRWMPRNEAQRAESRRLLSRLMRVDDMSRRLHEEACDAVSGDALRQGDEKAFQKVEILLVHDTEVLSAVRATPESCASGRPETRPIGGS